MRLSRVSVLVVGALVWAIVMLAIKATGGTREGVEFIVDFILDAGTGGILLATGAWAVGRPADRRIGWLLVLASVAWFAEDFNANRVPELQLVGSFTAYASAPTLALLALAFPSGRLTGWIERAILTGLAVVMLLILPLHDFFYIPPAGCCPALGFTLRAFHYDGFAKAWEIFGYVVASALALGVGALLVARWRRATVPTRRLVTPFVVSACTLVTLNVLDASWRMLTPRWPPTDPFTQAETIVTLLVAVSLPVGLLVLRLARARVIDAVLQIGERDPQTVVAEALQDPAARLVLGDNRLPDPRPGRAVSQLRVNERPVAMLEHDDTWAEDPGVLDALGRALALSLENRYLQDSRALLVRIADDERRRLESDLHDGAQQRLVAVSLLLGRLRDEVVDDPALEARIAQAADLLTDATEELRTLARGARPSLLLLHGVVGAVRQLVHDAPLPVDVHGAVPRSLPEREAAAYFVICEALANAGRHAAATRGRVALELVTGWLRIEVTDDGSGGAWMRPGGGLEGLRHRVEALGGELGAHDGASGGSVVRATLPWPAVSGDMPDLDLAG
jgi:signal transduction histidine kinase